MNKVGQTKCAILREIRRMVCELNGIDLTERDCMYSGDDCTGTCPFCDSRLERIDALLEGKRLLGETVRYEGLIELYKEKMLCLEQSSVTS